MGENIHLALPSQTPKIRNGLRELPCCTLPRHDIA